MREDVEAFGLSAVSIAGACAKPIVKGTLKVASAASDKIAKVIDNGQSLIDSIMENEAIAAAAEVQMAEKSNTVLEKLIKKTTGKKLLDTHSMLSDLCDSFNTSLDMSKEVCALAEALVKCYASQLDSLTPLEDEQWAELCANHMLEGLMLGFFKDGAMRFPMDNENAFVERALYWLMYVPMEEPINLVIGKLRQGKQFFGERNHLNADVLLKGPSLRCENDNGESIDFHLGNFEVTPSDDLNACFWRKRNFSHRSYDHSPLGYRLAMPWEVERLCNPQNVEHPGKKIASVAITQPKVISQTSKDQVNKAKPIDLDLKKCRDLAHDESIERLKKAGDERDKRIKKLETKVETQQNTIDEQKTTISKQNKEITELKEENKEVLEEMQGIKNELKTIKTFIGMHKTNKNGIPQPNMPNEAQKNAVSTGVNVNTQDHENLSDAVLMEQSMFSVNQNSTNNSIHGDETIDDITLVEISMNSQ